MIRSFTAAACLACALGLAPATAQAQGMSYAPGTQRYAITSELRQTAETPQGHSEMAASSVQQVSVSLAARGDSLDFTIVVDSAGFHSVPAVTMPPDLTRGKKATGVMSPRGKLHRIGGADSAANAMARTFGEFFPRLPASTVVGHTWTDTSITALQPNGAEFGRITTISTSRVTGDTTIAGVRAWKIERTSNGTGGGVRSSGGAEIVMQAAITLQSTTYMGMNGTYMGATTNSTSKITMTVASAGLSVPLVQELTTRVRPLDTP